MEAAAVSTVDMAWVNMPGRTEWNKRLHKKEFKSRVPMIMRDLAPQSTFNPNDAWEKEKTAIEKEERLMDKEKSSTKTAKKSKKAEQIVSQNKSIKADTSFIADIERIRNKKNEGGLLSIRKEMKTEKGRIVLLVEILNVATASNDRRLAYDVLWAIEDTNLYVKREIDFDIPKPETKNFTALIYDDKNAIQLLLEKVFSWRRGEDMIVKQITDMSDCLPPLSKFSLGFKLDPWQIKVLNWIDAKKSVVICAPTSSGKTVLSSYVAFMGSQRLQVLESKKAGNSAAAAAALDDEDDEDMNDTTSSSGGEVQHVLFVVPTEPLVWQVSAHFSKLFQENASSTKVAMVTNQFCFSMHSKQNCPPHVVVGTPSALESAMTKIRGRVSWLEGPKPQLNGIDRSQLPGGFHHYKWVVYDEVHSLNGAEGDALQRLIRLMNCNFLALSATVGNAEELRSWMEKVRGEQLNVEVVTAPREAWGGAESTSGEGDGSSSSSSSSTQAVVPTATATATAGQVEADEESRLVKLQQHAGRFINLQRHVWSTDSSGVCNLQPLHPLAAIESVNQIQRGIFSITSLPMTPVDSYTLWTRMVQVYPMESIADADPHVFFEAGERITLQRTKDYEDFLKEVLEELSHTHPEQTQSLLNQFSLPEPPKTIDLCDMILNLKDREMLPALVFHLNFFELVKLFKQLVGGLEWRQKNKYPTHYHSELAKQKQSEADMASAFEGMKTDKEKDEAMRYGGDQTEKKIVDTSLPHFEFVLGNKQLSVKEFEDICEEVKHEDKFKTGVVDAHALLRGLRRGVGLYIDEVSFPAYRRAVMRLATRGALSVVLSDSSLAFGVNMPFRTCIFCGEMGGLLDPLMAQQMSGRAGRRGLDVQGHLVYAASHSSFIRNLMLGQVPAITGGTNQARYHTQYLQGMLSWYIACNKQNSTQLTALNGQTLGEFLNNETISNYSDVSKQLLLDVRLIEACDRIDILANRREDEALLPPEDTHLAKYFDSGHTPSGYRPYRKKANCALLCMVWELRRNVPESIALGCMLPYIYDEFIRSNRKMFSSNEKLPEVVLFEFFAILLHFIDRHPCQAGATPLHEHPYILQNLEKWEEWEHRLTRHHDLLGSIPNGSYLMLPVAPGQPVDSTLFNVIRQHDKETLRLLSSEVKEMVKRRIWHVGNTLLVMHNCLYPDKSKYERLELITRSCFSFLRYLNQELIQEEIDFQDVSSYELENRTDTCAPLIPEIAPWGDAQDEPPALDPFLNAVIDRNRKKFGRKKKAVEVPEAAAAGTGASEGTEASTVTSASTPTSTTTKTTASNKTEGTVRATGKTAGATAAGAGVTDVQVDEQAEQIKKVKKMNPKEMKDALKLKGLSIQGSKTELLARLLDAIKIKP